MIGVLALDVTSDLVDLGAIISGEARAFRPHISILPRFNFVDPDLAADISCPVPAEVTLEVEGPYDNGQGLWWYESQTGTAGHRLLSELHNALAATLAGRIEPVTPDFWYTKYRPHMTIGMERGHSLPPIFGLKATALTLYVITSEAPLVVERHVRA